jgi:hypothetical protein
MEILIQYMDMLKFYLSVEAEVEVAQQQLSAAEVVVQGDMLTRKFYSPAMVLMGISTT